MGLSREVKPFHVKPSHAQVWEGFKCRFLTSTAQDFQRQKNFKNFRKQSSYKNTLYDTVLLGAIARALGARSVFSGAVSRKGGGMWILRVLTTFKGLVPEQEKSEARPVPGRAERDDSQTTQN